MQRNFPEILRQSEQKPELFLHFIETLVEAAEVEFFNWIILPVFVL
jgi:hypothetical protein